MKKKKTAPDSFGGGSYSLADAHGEIKVTEPGTNHGWPTVEGFTFEQAKDEDLKPPMMVEGPTPPEPHRYIITAEIQFDVGARNVMQAYKIFTDWIAAEFNAQHSAAETAAGSRSARPAIAPTYYEGRSIVKSEDGTPSSGRR